MKKPRPFSAAYGSAIILDCRDQDVLEENEFWIDIDQPDHLEAKQAERLAAWLISASKWIKEQSKKKVRK